MNEFKFLCPHCQQNLKADTALSGKQIQCPACKHLFQVPAAPGAASYTRESGRTWDTFVPPKKAGGLKVVVPAPGDAEKPK